MGGVEGPKTPAIRQYGMKRTLANWTAAIVSKYFSYDVRNFDTKHHRAGDRGKNTNVIGDLRNADNSAEAYTSESACASGTAKRAVYVIKLGLNGPDAKASRVKSILTITRGKKNNNAATQ